MQLYGGLGIVMFFVAILSRSGDTTRSLLVMDANDAESLVGVKLHARRVLIVYCATTVVGCLLIMAGGTGVFNAICFALSGVSTGGFSPLDESLGGLGGVGQVAVTVVCFSGAVPFYLYYRAFQGSWKTLFRDLQIQSMFVCCCVGAGLLSFSLWFVSQRSVTDSLLGGSLLAISAQTTTGFEPLRVASLGDTEKVLLLAPMIVGGSMGSSAGGLKLVRLLILVQLLRTAVVRASQPRHAVNKPHLFGQPLSERETEEASMLLFAFLVLIFVSWLPFVIYGYQPLNSLFEVVSACGTVGLSSGVSAEPLPLLLKLVLSADMLMGRLEIYAWLVILSRRTWFGKQVQSS